jgi:hypothetical protein
MILETSMVCNCHEIKREIVVIKLKNRVSACGSCLPPRETFIRISKYFVINSKCGEVYCLSIIFNSAPELQSSGLPFRNYVVFYLYIGIIGRPRSPRNITPSDHNLKLLDTVHKEGEKLGNQKNFIC